MQGNEVDVDDQLGGEATNSSQCDDMVTLGNGGLKDMFWPTEIVQTARQATGNIVCTEQQDQYQFHLTSTCFIDDFRSSDRLS